MRFYSRFLTVLLLVGSIGATWAGNTIGVIDGIDEGGAEAFAGVVQGIDEGGTEGIDEGGTEGIDEGGTEGIDEGGTESLAGGIKGIDEGGTEGIDEGGTEGIDEGGTEGIDEGGTEGIDEGGTESLAGGIEGIDEGGTEGIDEGGTEGIDEGGTEGIDEGGTEGIDEGGTESLAGGIEGIDEGGTEGIDEGGTEGIDEGGTESLAGGIEGIDEGGTEGIDEGGTEGIDEGGTEGIDEGGTDTVVVAGPATLTPTLMIGGYRVETARASVFHGDAPAALVDIDDGEIVMVSGQLTGEMISASRLQIVPALNGMVEKIDHERGLISILGQSVSIDNATIVTSALSSIEDIKTGAWLQIDGVTSNAGLLATRIAPATTRIAAVSGTIGHTQAGALTFSINSLKVDYSMTTVIDLPNGMPDDGLNVRVIGVLTDDGNLLQATRIIEGEH